MNALSDGRLLADKEMTSQAKVSLDEFIVEDFVGRVKNAWLSLAAIWPASAKLSPPDRHLSSIAGLIFCLDQAFNETLHARRKESWPSTKKASRFSTNPTASQR